MSNPVDEVESQILHNAVPELLDIVTEVENVLSQHEKQQPDFTAELENELDEVLSELQLLPQS